MQQLSIDIDRTCECCCAALVRELWAPGAACFHCARELRSLEETTAMTPARLRGRTVLVHARACYQAALTEEMERGIAAFRRRMKRAARHPHRHRERASA